MAEFSNIEYADIVFCYGYSNGNTHVAQREYQRRYPNRRLPSVRVFSRTFRRIRESGSVCERVQDRGTNYRTEAPTTVEREEAILNIVRNDPTISIRRVAARLGLSSISVWRVLHREGLYAYHMTPVHELQAGDMQKRMDFCNWLLERDLEDYTFLDNILWTDEAQFTKTGIVNFHNLHNWAFENPHAFRQTRSQYRFTVNVWAGIIGGKLLGPHILPDRMNSENYLEFLQNELPNIMEDLPLSIRRDLTYQHDGAPSHTGRIVRQWMDTNYSNRWIGRNGPYPWPPRSPDLTPLDFFFWGTMKDRVYSRAIRTGDELIERIHQAANNIRETLEDIDLKRSLKRRALLCIQTQGGHVENILNH